LESVSGDMMSLFVVDMVRRVKGNGFGQNRRPLYGDDHVRRLASNSQSDLKDVDLFQEGQSVTNCYR
jgi:hypothetical protein